MIKWIASILIFTVGPMCLPGDARARQAGATGPRVIVASKGSPIAKQLRSDDRDVILDLASEPPSVIGPPPGKGVLEWRTEGAPVVLVAQVAAVEPFVAPDGDYIWSAVKFRALEVLKSPPDSSMKVGDEYRWIVPGGTVDIGGKRVTGLVRWARELRAKTTYLLFASVRPDNGELRMSFYDVFEVSAGGLRSVAKGHTENGLSDEDLAAVVAKVKLCVPKPQK